MKTGSRIGLLAVIMLLTGCFDLTEEFWINEDGSGRIKYTLGLSEAIANMASQQSGSSDICADLESREEELREKEWITSVSISKRNESAMLYCIIDIGVKDFRRLSDIGDGSVGGDSKDYKNPFIIEDLENGHVSLKQDFSSLRNENSKTAGENEAMDQMMQAMFGPLMAGRYVTVIAHASIIESSNGEIDQSGKSVTWRKPVFDMFTGTADEYRFEMVFDPNTSVLSKIKNWFKTVIE